MPQRFLVLTASMGAGHDTVAGELAHRLRTRGHTVAVRDVLTLLPAGVGRALRAGYRGTVRHLPQLYGGIYATFLACGEGPRPNSSPLAALAERPLLRLVEGWRPDAVVATFHLSAQVTGRLRARGALPVPAAVVVIDFAVHRGWVHDGNDLTLCVTEQAARDVRSLTGRRAEVTGPVVSEDFFTAGGEAAGAWREAFARRAPGRPPVLLSTGAWGVVSDLPRTVRSLAGHGCLPVLLCAHDERLRHRAATLPGLPLGWVDDMPGLMAASRALVENSAGQTASQALAAGLPVVGHRPLPGHGEEGVRAMAAAGLSEEALTNDGLLAAVDRAVEEGPERRRRLAAGKEAFRSDAAWWIAELARGAVPDSLV